MRGRSSRAEPRVADAEVADHRGAGAHAVLRPDALAAPLRHRPAARRPRLHVVRPALDHPADFGDPDVAAGDGPGPAVLSSASRTASTRAAWRRSRIPVAGPARAMAPALMDPIAVAACRTRSSAARSST